MIKGINQEFSGESTPQGYGYFSKNAVISDKLNEITNERGTKLVDALSIADITSVIGIVVFGTKIIIFYKSDNSNSIGVYDEDTDTFQTKLTHIGLNFNIAYPIVGRAKLNSFGQLFVAFTDNFNPPRYINLDTAQSTDDLSLYSLFPSASNPNIHLSAVTGGGGFLTGVYFVTVAYVDSNNSATGWSYTSDPLYIINGDINQDWWGQQGATGGIGTSKAIRVRLNTLDTSYKRVRIGVVSRVNDITTFKMYKEVEYSGDNLDVTLTGTETTTDLGLAEAITINQNFTTAKEIESLNDQLFLADLRTADTRDFQRLANRMVINWRSDLVNVAHGSDVDGNDENRTFMHDEVYGFYAQFELPNGSWSDWFHIPGAPLNAGHRTPSTLANGVRINGQVPKNFQLEDTAYVDFHNTVSGVGGMSRWENENEVYPATFPDFAGEKVRHHKFPSIGFMQDNVYGINNEYGSKKWDKLSIIVQLVSIPTDLVGKFTSYRIGFAKKEFANMTVLGYDLAQLDGNGRETPFAEFNDSLFMSPVGNWVLAVRTGPFTISLSRPNKRYLRMHSPDMLYYKYPVQNIYLASHIKVMVNNVADKLTEGKLTHGEVVYFDVDNWGSDVNDTLNKTAAHISNFATSNVWTGRLPDNQRYKALTDAKYIPHGVRLTDNNGTIINVFSEETLHVKVESDMYLDYVEDTGETSQAGLYYMFNENASLGHLSPGMFEESLISAIKILKANLFVGYDQQVVIALNDKLGANSSQYQLVGGDGYINTHSFIVTSSGESISSDPAFNAALPTTGARNIKVYMLESRINLSQRYVEQGNLDTYFYPYIGGNFLTTQTDYWYHQLNLTNNNPNKILYNKDYNAQNEYAQYGIFNPDKPNNSDLPFAIARSQKASRATDVDDGWRIFKANDIFYTVRDRGYIINLVAWGTDNLLIHHERALFKTRDKAVLQSDITLISLGSGDLFALEPAEVGPTEYGQGGTQHRFGCVLCEAGYFFIDAQTGELFLYQGGKNYKDMGKGLLTFFKNTFKQFPVGDNPLNDYGITVGYSKETYQLVVSLKASQVFTAAFDLRKEEWLGFKDGVYDMFITTRRNLYSFRNSSLWLHNKGLRGTIHGTLYPFFVDLVFNENPTVEKILDSIEYMSVVTRNDGSKPLFETLTSITVWNDYFCTGKLNINQLENIADYEGKNSAQVERTWRFNEFSDAVKDVNLPFVAGVFDDYRPIGSNITVPEAWFDRAAIKGKYFFIRLEYSNEQDKLVSLRNLIVNNRQVYG